MDFILYLFVLLLTGALVGFASGLLGVGGGFIMVPIQFFLLTSLGVDPTTAIRVAFGTSLAVILPTAISGALGHARRGAVLFRPMILMGISGLISSLIGGTIAANTPGIYLKIIFGILVLISGIWMLIAKYPEISGEPKKGVLSYIIIGFITGLLSGLLGVGGGVVLVPILVILMGFSMIRAVGTSTAVIIFTSLGGIIAYTANGFNIAGLPPFSIGYINLIQFAVLAIISVPMAQIGVKASHKLPEKQLRYIFILVMFYIAFKMIGVFSWIGLPL
ncbi:sulfite exporter TauE/SafE family protein [Methanobacterium sp.]|uniref:sulfite exporter TauE/SafE family protein n=1 Tax=Methanobacterium sp. TaxID=2164 RepID=UPI003C744D27